MSISKSFKNRIIYALRKLSLAFPERSKAKRKAKIGDSIYICATCERGIYIGIKENLVKLKLYPEKNKKEVTIVKGKISLDHINPVVNPDKGWEDWNTYIEKLFCDETGWQVLCNECHDIKTEEENKNRDIKKKGKFYENTF